MVNQGLSRRLQRDGEDFTAQRFFTRRGVYGYETSRYAQVGQVRCYYERVHLFTGHRQATYRCCHRCQFPNFDWDDGRFKLDALRVRVNRTIHFAKRSELLTCGHWGCVNANDHYGDLASTKYDVVPTMDRSQFGGRLCFVTVRLFSDDRQYFHVYLVSIGGPNSRLLMEDVYRESRGDRNACYFFREGCPLIVLRRGNQLRDDAFNDHRVDVNVRREELFFICVQIIGWSGAVLSARGVASNFICNFFFRLAFFRRFKRFVGGYMASRFRVRAYVRHFRNDFFIVNDGAIESRLLDEDPIHRCGAIGSPFFAGCVFRGGAVPNDQGPIVVVRQDRRDNDANVNDDFGQERVCVAWATFKGGHEIVVGSTFNDAMSRGVFQADDGKEEATW